jgi:hypothetical protein
MWSLITNSETSCKPLAIANFSKWRPQKRCTAWGQPFDLLRLVVRHQVALATRSTHREDR